MFALIDCNNFYVSCERVFNPKLNNRPVVILSNNDGCAISRSNEAKALGIPMGAPAFKYEKIFKKYNVEVFSSNFTLYGDMSSRVMSILSRYTPNIEIYSIDEAFLKFEGFDNYDLESYCKKIQKIVLKHTGIPISIGIAPTKALSKVANRIAKKFPEKTNGVHLINSNMKRVKALKWLKIKDVWGIGFRHTERLKNIGIHTAYDFINLEDGWVRKNMSVVGLRLKRELEGESVLNLEEVRSPKKAIATTRSFEGTISDFEKIKERISTFAICCAEKLRTQQSNCSSIYVFVRSNKFQKNKPQYRNGIVITIPFSTNSNIIISKYAVEGLKKIFRQGIDYKKAGVIVMGLNSINNYQYNLFENEDIKHQELMRTIDFIQKKEGQSKIKLASQDLKKRWKMKQEKLSASYTCKINEIIKVK
ncbi:MAG: Y-family DNA polymerase [Candidatus Marinimicrobia bacterium]|nr:Y-family DNA polymerase [Candidatus Neomarinimicrobiota bacterium]